MKYLAILMILLCAGCASEIEAYNEANPAETRSGKILVWRGLGVEFTGWEYGFKGKPSKDAKP